MSTSLLGDRYQILAEVGRGGMGVVFVAYDPMLERYVAIKLLNPDYSKPEALERLRREARMQARLEHANIVRVYDVGSLGRGLSSFFVMEYVQGIHLSQLSSEISLASRLYVIGEVAKGLTFAHDRNFIHRDLKTENILASVNGEIKLADFGLGRGVEEAGITRQGVTVGSFQYMAPEQASGRPIDQRTDLYSLGVLLYRVTTGKVPFIGRQHEVMAQHLNSKPKPPRKIDPSVPEELEHLILRSLKKDPNLRPQSAEEVRAELEQIRGRYWPIITPDELRKGIGYKAESLAVRSLNFPCPGCTVPISESHREIDVPFSIDEALLRCVFGPIIDPLRYWWVSVRS
jgi:serine/threonine-protein kinase